MIYGQVKPMTPQRERPRCRHSNHQTPPQGKPSDFDLCNNEHITDAQMAQLLNHVYDRFLVCIHHHRIVDGDEDNNLISALENCYIGDPGTEPETWHRPRLKRITKRERLIRLCGVALNRVYGLARGEPVGLSGADLDLLDALQDVANSVPASDLDWTVTHDGELLFD
jgi:hypothetical protein